MTFDRDGLLDLLKLERRRTAADRVVSSLGLFVGGAVLGAAVAALLTPRSGRELRAQLMDATTDLKERTIDPLISRVQGSVNQGVGASSQPKV